MLTVSVVALPESHGLARQPSPAVTVNVTEMSAIPAPVGLFSASWLGVTTRTLGAGAVPPWGATDDVADTGHTLRSVEQFCEGKVGDVRTAVIYEKSHSVVKCDYIWKRTDLWINFPWSDQDPVAKRDWSVKDA